MAKWFVFFLVVTSLVAQISARNVPHGKAVGLDDNKNFVTYGGMGGYSGVGDNGLPIGGVFGGVGSGGNIGGVGGYGGIGGGIGTGAGGGVGGGLGCLTCGGAGTGVGTGTLPFP